MTDRTLERLVRHFRWAVTGRSWRAGKGGGLRLGTAGEFEGYRPFQTGDDLRLLDSRVYTRLRTRVARVVREDSGLPVTLLIDGSASMAHAARGPAVARLVAFFVALAQRDGDPLRGAVFSGDRVDPLSADTLRQFDAWWASRALDDSSAYGSVFARIPRDPAGQGIVIVISDAFGLEDLDRELLPLGRWARPFWIAPWTADEREPDVSGRVRLRSREAEPVWSGIVDASTAAAYREQLARLEASLARRLRAWGGDFFAVHAEDELPLQLASIARRGTLIA